MTKWMFIQDKFEGLFGKEFQPIKTPKSERYYPEIDDST
jgi:hypothetical protein